MVEREKGRIKEGKERREREKQKRGEGESQRGKKRKKENLARVPTLFIYE